jgi:CMP-2-keto-3-deoxyoctulosonic acid synthetase
MSWIGLGVAVLVASMVWTVRRQTEAREVAVAIDSLESAEVVERARFAAAMRRADSLASRVRLLEAAAELELRPATDEEISFIEDVSPPTKGTSAEVPEPR